MRFHFSNYSLDTARRELRFGDELIAVEPQVFDLLEHVIRCRDHVVSKDDLMTKVWNGRNVSESTVANRINAARQAIGDDGKQQKLIRTVPRRGIRFVGEAQEDAAEMSAGQIDAHSPAHAARQGVTFCQAPDGVKLAVAATGNGAPVVRVGTWLTHIEHDWQSPVWGPFYQRLTSQFRLIRYDARGCGLSERNVEDISFAAFVHDLECVVDSLGLRHFALFGSSQGAAVAIAYAARHPDRVSRLVLNGGRAVSVNKLGDPADMARHEALLTLIRHGWGQDNPAFLQVFTSRNWPDATPEEMRSLNELQRLATSPETAVRIRLAYRDFDLRDLLPRVTAPTLVLHSRHDAGVPLELGLELARKIPNARMVELDSRSHQPLPAEPAWPRFLDELCTFLSEKSRSALRLVTP